MTEVEGVDYSPEAIEATRQELAAHRNHALTLGEMRYAVLMSHVIAYLAQLKEYEEGVREKPIGVEAGKRAAAAQRPKVAFNFPPLPPQQSD